MELSTTKKLGTNIDTKSLVKVHHCEQKEQTIPATTAKRASNTKIQKKISSDITKGNESDTLMICFPLLMNPRVNLFHCQFYQQKKLFLL